MIWHCLGLETLFWCRILRHHGFLRGTQIHNRSRMSSMILIFCPQIMRRNVNIQRQHIMVLTREKSQLVALSFLWIRPHAILLVSCRSQLLPLSCRLVHTSQRSPVSPLQLQWRINVIEQKRVKSTRPVSQRERLFLESLCFKFWKKKIPKCLTRNLEFGKLNNQDVHRVPC